MTIPIIANLTITNIDTDNRRKQTTTITITIMTTTTITTTNNNNCKDAKNNYDTIMTTISSTTTIGLPEATPISVDNMNYSPMALGCCSFCYCCCFSYCFLLFLLGI